MGEVNVTSRREFLWRFGGGALASLLSSDRLLAGDGRRLGDGVVQRQGGLHHRAKATRVIQLYMSGAASQCDTFDHKPRLIREHGKAWDPGEKVELFQSSPGT